MTFRFVNPVHEITPRELADRLSRGENLAFLDVREPSERNLCAIRVPSALADWHVPMREVAARVAEIRDLAAGVPVVVYCHHGVRSRMAAEWLARQGVEGLWNLTGGIDAWSSDVDPEIPRY